MRWSESDNYFVNGSLKVYSVGDLSSEPLKLVSEENIVYDGPEDEDFRSLLLDNGFRVNRQGKAVVRVPKRNDEEEYNFFLLQRVVPLDAYGFTNEPSSPTPQEVTPQEVKVLKCLLEETRVDLAKKNAEVDELQRQILDWKLTMDAITESMKKVFVNVDDLKHQQPPPLPPPPPPEASTSGGYPLISVVVRFLNTLRSHLFLDKEEELGLGAAFLVAANEILASIATIFYQRTGLKISMETSSTTITPADLIQNLSNLREFVENRFFIDGSVIVKAFRLINEKDIPVIFRDSEAGVAELHRKETGAKSIDNIDGKSIFYGYFNIPGVGKFKGVLTRIDVTLPDEIMVKLKNYNELDGNKFWFVKANGEAILTLKNKSLSSAIVDSSWVFLEFLLRINRTFVNKKGKYLKFEFTAIKHPRSRYKSGSLNYYDKDYFINSPFSRVQFDTNERPAAFVVEGQVSLPVDLSCKGKNDLFELILKDRLGEVCAFEVKNFCFIGNIREDKKACFRNNAVVEEFFEDGQFGEGCYVDTLATTFFILNPVRTLFFSNDKKVVPKFVI